jgi:branched-chain amino acid transport system substrate-binding protein
MKSVFKRAGLTALSVVTAAGLAAGGAQAGDTIKIGSFLAVTGGASFLGDPEKKTLEMYVDKINADGGVLGKQLELIVYDSGGSPKKSGPFAKRLINDDKVDIILAGSTTGATMAVIPIVQKAGIPFISFGGAGVIINPVKKWVFKTPHTDTLAVQKIFTDMKGRSISKIGLLSGSGGFDKSCRKNVQKLAPGAGMTLVADETHGKGDTDMTAQITKIKNAGGVQAMMYCGFGAATSIVAKNGKQLGLSIPHYQTHGSASKSFIKNAGGGAEGVRLPAAALVVVDALPDSHPQKKVASAYKKMYEAKAGSEISSFGGHAYDGLMIAVEAIKRAGSTDKAAVLAEIEKTNNYIGVDGIYTMSPTDHLGLDEASFVMVEVSGGDWKMLK